MDIVGRVRELARADELIAEASAGRGAVLLIEGVAGIGKTRLLREISAAAAAAGHHVLRANASELEQPFAFGLARQAIEPVLEAMAPLERDELLAGVVAPARPALEGVHPDDAARESHAVLNGIFWLLARLAQRRPLLLALDDVHWADAGTRRLLAHLAPRAESVALLVVATARPRNGALTGTEVLTPRALDEEGVGTVVRETLGAAAAPELTRACLAASGGNPFLLVELVRELREDPTPRGVHSVTPESVARSVAARLHALGPSASALARAVAILDRTALGTAAALAGIDEDAAVTATDELARAGLLAGDTPLRFAHPLLRSAVDADLAPGERGRLHAAAARLLEQRGAPVEHVAAHLLHVEPRGEPGAADVLARAGRNALSSGAPDTAVRLLRRALDESPGTAAGEQLLYDLATAESAVGAPEARSRMRAVVDTARDPALRARALRDLTWQTGGPEGQRDLLPLYEPVVRDVDDRELRLTLESARLTALFLTPGQLDQFMAEIERFRDLPGDTPGECGVLAWVTEAARLAGSAADEVGALAERAARHPISPGAGRGPVWLQAFVLPLISCDRFATADAVIAPVFDLAREHGSASAFASASLQRAVMRFAEGDLVACEADARAALDAEALGDFYAFQPLIPLLHALADQGKFADGETLLADWALDGDLGPGPVYAALLAARGRLRAAAGDMAAARADLGAARRAMDFAEGFAIEFEARLDEALVLHACGETVAARRAADEALDAASAWGARRAAGGAMRVAGLLRGGAEGLEMLREAAAMLGDSPARLWHARALVDLGAALRRANQRSECRPPLRAGLELAEACGAVPLAEHARRELAASGGRVPPRAGSGLAELTASERRVAEHAAQGLSNPEIAQRLFVTIKTVEMHLSNTYRKLGIGSRHELPGALGHP